MRGPGYAGRRHTRGCRRRRQRLLEKIRQGRQRTDADKGGRGYERHFRARGPVEHPGRNLQPTVRRRPAQRAAENDTMRLLDRFMDDHPHPEPRMPSIKQLSKNGPVGVLKPCCTTRRGRTRDGSASVKRRCKPSLTPSLAHRKKLSGHKPSPHRPAPDPTRPAQSVCQIECILLQLIAPYMPPQHRLGRRRTTDLRSVVEAIFYISATGCQWRMLPKDFPP